MPRMQCIHARTIIHELFPQSHIFRKIKISGGFHMLQNQFHALSDELACSGLHPNSFEMSARPSPVDVLLISTPGLLKTSTCYIFLDVCRKTFFGHPKRDVRCTPREPPFWDADVRLFFGRRQDIRCPLGSMRTLIC